MQPGAHAVIDLAGFGQVLDLLRASGYRLIGPVRRDGAIVYDDISSAADLPAGWTEEQGPGIYRLQRRNDGALFGYATAPDSWKRALHPPVLRLWQGRRVNGDLQVADEPDDAGPRAFIGVRACDLHAIAIQDRVFLAGQYADPAYKARSENVFIVAVNCGQAGGTCFCSSMGTGPRATTGFDLALTEIMDGGHRFLVEVGTARGAEILDGVPHRPADGADGEAAARIVAEAAAQMGRSLDTRDIKEILYRNLEHPRWQEVAARCLTCGNCTMVCPTCFCTTVEDATDLAGDHAERWRRWGSCFSLEFSYVHGGSIRASAASRYRQWLTHKLATWIDQFGTSGCVGCGRCITWCPVGIDITEEVRAIRETSAAMAGAGKEEHRADA